MSALAVLDHHVNALDEHDERADQARELRAARDKFAELIAAIKPIRERGTDSPLWNRLEAAIVAAGGAP